MSKNSEKKIITVMTKINLAWYRITGYLYNIDNFCITEEDEEFYKLFRQLRDYVEAKITPIVDDEREIDCHTYVICEQQVKLED